MIREFTKSVVSFPLAMSMLGAQEVAMLLTPRKAQESLYFARQAILRQFDDLVWAAFQVGDQVQRQTVDWAWDALTLRAFTPSALARQGSDLAWQATETARVLGSSPKLAWQQLRNNYEVFNLVKHVRDLLHVPQGPDFPLERLIGRAYELGEYPDLWAIEGLGHDYADRFWGPAENIRNLLTNEIASALPENSLTMMHAGIGLSFAQHLLQTVTPFSPECEIRRMLETFITLCRQNSRRGYIGAAYESLGLVTRTWNAEMVPSVDRLLVEMAPDVAGYFWHGVGRALYFLPIYFVPGLLSPWRSLDRDAPSELARLNMRAGLAWATTLVNLRQPAIIEDLVARHGSLLEQNGGFANGVASAVIVAWDITPGDTYVRALAEYQPSPSLARQWDVLVRRPCLLALERYYDVLRRCGHLGEVFHYQDFNFLMQRLEGDCS
jgi:hypothetical protein